MRKRLRKKNDPRPVLSPLCEASTPALISELKRRSLGCVIAVITLDSTGDCWCIEAKGSPPLLEGMFLKLEEQYLTSGESDEKVPR